MPSSFTEIRTLVRQRLIEPTAIFWSDQELHDILTLGAKDLWRDIVDLKQEHYLRINDTDPFIASGADEISGVPADVHKIYLVEPRNVSRESETRSVWFTPLDYNHDTFRSARTAGTVYPPFGEFFYSIQGQGAPVGAPTIKIAPRPSAALDVTIAYCPTLDPMLPESVVPIPGECDNALIAWGVAFARAKEREDRSPDPGWIAVYSTEKAHLLQSLGLRQYQEPQYVEGTFDALW